MTAFYYVNEIDSQPFQQLLMHTSAKTLRVYCIFASCFSFVCQLFMLVFISSFSSGTYCACIPRPWQRAPIVSVEFNFIPFCCYTSGQKSVIEPRVILACKNRPFQTLQQRCKEGIKTRVSARFADLGEMHVGHRCPRRSGTPASAECWRQQELMQPLLFWLQ